MTKNIKQPLNLGITGFVGLVKRIGEGQLAHTFLAHVLYEGRVRRAYLKVYDLSAQPKAVLNEVIGYLLAQVMDVPAPDAFFVDVPTQELLRFGWTGGVGWVRAVGTLEAHDPASATDGTAKTLYLRAGMANLPGIRDRLLKAPSGRALVAFDEVVANPDRNIGNIVFSWKHGVVAIDHGSILGGANWQPHTLNSAHTCPNLVFQIVSSTPLGAAQKSAVQAAGEVLQETFFRNLGSLQAALGYRETVLSTAVFDFIWWRALGLKSRMVHMLGLVA